MPVVHPIIVPDDCDRRLRRRILKANPEAEDFTRIPSDAVIRLCEINCVNIDGLRKLKYI